jgi:hypothetical protein
VQASRSRAALLLAAALMLAAIPPPPATTSLFSAKIPAPMPAPATVGAPMLPADVSGDTFPSPETLFPIHIPAVICALPWPCHEALQVAACESGLDPHAVGEEGEKGIFQVMPRFWGPVPADSLGQVLQAYHIWQEHGWEPWSCQPHHQEMTPDSSSFTSSMLV